MPQAISIIMPVLHHGALLESALQSLQHLRARGHELIVVDGGSRDHTLSLARRYADRVVMSGAGRALQMNAGAEYAKHEILLFLHPDTRLPEHADALIQAALTPQAARWGRFDIRLDHPRAVYRLIEHSINWHSHLGGVATGEQAIFVEREYFERVGCYDRLPLLEDVTLSKKLLHFAHPARIAAPALVSARRWEQGGVLRTSLLRWGLRMAFLCGADPFRLAEWDQVAGHDEV